MRIFGSLVAVAILAMAVLAAQQTLTATIPSGANSFRIANCDNVDGPSKKSLTISVENPLESYMSVKYYVYNLSSSQWVDKGKLCNAPGLQSTQCPTILEIIAGKQGNGTITNDLVKLVATIEGSQDTYEKVFSFTVNHFTGDREAALLAQLSANTTSLTAAREQCSAKPVCCTDTVSGKLDSAQASFSTVEGEIGGCHLTNAYNALVQGETNVKDVASTLRPCALSSPTPGGTPQATPQATGSPTPTPEQSMMPTPPPQQTPTPAASSCPIGALLALLGAGLFAFKR